LGDQAGQVRQRGQTMRTLTFAVAGLLIIITFIAFHFFNIAETRKERERHSQEISGLRFAAVVQNSSDVILLASRKGVVTLVNEASQSAWGLTPKNCVGKHILNLFKSSNSDDLLNAFDEAMAKPNVDIETSIRIEVEPEVHHFFQVHIRNLLNNVHIGGLLLTFHDITERAAVEQALTHQATHDRLTGLPNRSQIMARLGEALTNSKITGQSIGALFIDLDNFKTINDTLGHEMGDLLLVKVAKRIQRTIRPSDMAARLGGDEFVILLNNAGGADAGETIAKRIAEQFARPFHLGDEDVPVTASIGVALSQESDAEPNDLLRRADTAMYQAKHQGKSGYVIFDSSMKMQPEGSHDLESNLQAAVKEKSFDLQFQPIVTLHGQEANVVEAFLRWHHPAYGIVPPQKLIPMIEDLGLMPEVGDWILEEVCRNICRWSNEVSVSINLSGKLLVHPGFVASVSDTLTRFDISPSKIKFEITESDLLADLEHSRTVCAAFRSLGIRIAIDDFGTGQSSMEYLNGFPADGLKVDRAITDQLGEDPSSDRILKAIIDSAHSQHMTVTGEGIETDEQLRILKELNCDYGQGFLFARPMSAIDVAARFTQKAQIGASQVL
jgi:diguanylate cyclase (GGDEF)-like protein/PAS domain S-box-containing protein